MLISKKEFDREPVYNENYLKTKIKPHGDFYDKKPTKLDSNNTCLAVITSDSAFKKDDSYYPRVFFKKFKYIEKKSIRHIHDNLTDFFYSSNESDEE